MRSSVFCLLLLVLAVMADDSENRPFDYGRSHGITKVGSEPQTFIRPKSLSEVVIPNSPIPSIKELSVFEPQQNIPVVVVDPVYQINEPVQVVETLGDAFQNIIQEEANHSFQGEVPIKWLYPSSFFGDAQLVTPSMILILLFVIAIILM